MARTRSRMAYISPEWFGDVLCGWCGEVLAGRDRGDDGPNGEQRYYLHLPSGVMLKPDGLTWALTKRARERLAAGKAPAVRRQTSLSFGAMPDKARERVLERGVLFAVDKGTQQAPRRLPLQLECPYCNSVQTLSPEVLEVDNSSVQG